MKTMIPLFLLTLVALTSCSQQRYTPSGKRTTLTTTTITENVLVGKWSEYMRTSKKLGKAYSIKFSDPLMLHFFADSTLYYYYPDGKISKFRYQVNKDNQLVMSDGKIFKTIKLVDNELQIESDDYKSFLHRVDKFNFAPIERLKPEIELGKIVPLDAKFLQGVWKVYKKSDANFDPKNTYLYSIEIGESLGANQHKVRAAVDAIDKIMEDDGVLIATDNKLTLNIMKQSKSYTVLKAADKELVLQDGEVIYYLTNLGK